MIQRVVWIVFFGLVARAAQANPFDIDTLIIGNETVYLEEQPVKSGDVNYWISFQEDYRQIPRTIRWGIQVEGGGMLVKNAWPNSNLGIPLSQFNPNKSHWRFSPSLGVLGFAMLNETLGFGIGYKQKKWSRSLEVATQTPAADTKPFGYLYNESGFYQIEIVDVDSTGFYELDTAMVSTQMGTQQVLVNQIPFYLVYAYVPPRSLWSYQGMLGGVYSAHRISGCKSSFLNAERSELSGYGWSSRSVYSWTMFARATVSRYIRGNCRTFMAISSGWPFQIINTEMGKARLNSLDLTFGISLEY